MGETSKTTSMSLIHKLIQMRTEPSFRGQRANIRRGADKFTEHYAYPYVYPALGPEVSDREKTTMVRVAALIAEFTDIPQNDSGQEGKAPKSFGRWCSELSVAWSKRNGDSHASFDPRNPDEIARRLAYLHTQDFEEAFRSVWRLMAMANSLQAPPACDYFAIYRLLSRWGNGVSEQSRAVRMKVLQDYYSSLGFTQTQNTDQQEQPRN